jgi:hypothetical protein
VDEYGYTDRIVINTFNATLHEYIADKYGKKYRQHVYYPVSYMPMLHRDPYEYAYCVCMFRSFYNKLNMASKEEFDAMIARGVQPWAGASVKDEKTVDEAIERGAYLITCNNPDEILALLRKRGYHD